MKDNPLLCTDNISVLIPYTQLESLLQCANNLHALQADLHRTREELDALRIMYFEVLYKIREIER